MFKNPSVASYHLQDKIQAAYEAENTKSLHEPAPTYFWQTLLLLSHVNTIWCLFFLQSTPCSYVVCFSLLHSTCCKCEFLFLSRFHSADTSRPLRILIIPSLRPFVHPHTHLALHLEQWLLCARHSTKCFAMCYVICLSPEPYQISTLITLLAYEKTEPQRLFVLRLHS